MRVIELDCYFLPVSEGEQFLQGLLLYVTLNLRNAGLTKERSKDEIPFVLQVDLHGCFEHRVG